MANSLFSPLQLVMLSALCNVAAQLNGSYIKQGSCLSPTETSSWLSPSGLFSFGFFPQGNNRYGVGIVAKKTVVWTANRDDPPVSEDVALYFTMGRFILVQQSQNLTTDVFNVE
ncbi:Bulb-type lectin domain-containing protein [Heracleum sosnowskyi]|uniref:Bulb-type lectin domain-containing protein n=1 Tax=Heracleum sosnowskyi TaxID=360622 RepID=A0AAD8HSB8_9APIA|nr:Bulb-type lectin domain-containing protein [Heracleum sosnowskyi]